MPEGKHQGEAMLKCTAAAASLALCGLLLIGTAHATDYPAGPVHIVVPYAPGGGVDLIARVIAQQLSNDLKQSAIVENKPGASGIVGSQYVAAAKPDGLTLLYASGVTQATATFILANTNFDLLRDLTPITETVNGPEIVVVNPKVPVKTFGDLVTYIKEKTDTFRWGMGGAGTLEHLSITALDKRLGVSPVVASFNGVAPVITATMSGELTATLVPLAGVKSHIESGTLRALAVASAERMEQMPDLPTIASFGFPGFEAANWQGIWGPKQMPEDLVRTIQASVAKALAVPAVKESIAKSGFAVSPTKDPTVFAAYVKSQVENYGPMITDLGLAGSQ
jgi:tripartite-type tricarboxylate transporter receptor subunit TctC